MNRKIMAKLELYRKKIVSLFEKFKAYIKENRWELLKEHCNCIGMLGVLGCIKKIHMTQEFQGEAGCAEATLHGLELMSR